MEAFLEKLGIKENNLGGFAGEWLGSGPDLVQIMRWLVPSHMFG